MSVSNSGVPKCNHPSRIFRWAEERLTCESLRFCVGRFISFAIARTCDLSSSPTGNSALLQPRFQFTYVVSSFCTTQGPRAGRSLPELLLFQVAEEVGLILDLCTYTHRN